MSEREQDDKRDEQVAEELDKAREEEPGADESQPWAKTSSGDADSITTDS